MLPDEHELADGSQSASRANLTSMSKPDQARTKLPSGGEAEIGPDTAQHKRSAPRKIVAVDKAELQRREAAWRQQRTAMQQRAAVQQRAMVRQRKGR